jgi:hypothetical protein
MHVHTPTRFPGPVTRARSWWTQRRRPNASAPIRHDLVQRVRQEIADGAYETPEKLAIALHRLLDRLEG